jgi:hypothetical protein
MATIGKLAVQITAETAGLAAGLRSADGQISSFSDKADFLVGKLKAVGPAAILAGAAFAGALVRNVANAADALGDLSERTGIAVEDLSRLQYVAQMSGGSADVLNTAVIRLSKGMSEAASGTGDALKAFDAMGVSVKNADGSLRSQVEVLSDVADKFTEYEDGAAKTALAMQIFGRQGAEMIGFLNQGSAGIRELSEESDRLGNTISTNTAKAAGEFNDNLDRLNTAIGGLGREIAGPLIQSMADLTNRLNDASKAGNGLLSLAGPIRTGLNGIAVVMETIAVLGVNLAYVLKMTGNELGGLAAQAVAVASLDFKGAATIGELMRQDAKAARAEVDRLSAAILGLRKSGDVSSIAGLDFRAEDARFARTKPSAFGSAPQATAPGAAGGASAKSLGSIFDDGDPVQKELAARFERQREMEARMADESEAKYAEGLMRRVELLRESIKTEEEIALERQAKELESLTLAQENNLITQQDGMLLEQELMMKHMDELARIRGSGMKAIEDINKNSWTNQAKEFSTKLGEMTAAAASGSKAMFNINKVAAIANVLLKAQESITNSYAFGSRIGGPVLGAAMAGVAAAATLAQVNAIRSQQFSSGGSVSTPSSSGGVTAPTQTAAAGGTTQTISIQGISSGDLFSGDSVRVLIDRLIDAQRNGARIVLA